MKFIEFLLAWLALDYLEKEYKKDECKRDKCNLIDRTKKYL
jgi:hypothetical protein